MNKREFFIAIAVTSIAVISSEAITIEKIGAIFSIVLLALLICNIVYNIPTYIREN